MAGADVAAVTLTLDTVSSDLIIDSADNVAVSAGIARITGVSPVDNLFIACYENGGGDATLVVAVGDRPPGMRADATLTLTVASGTLRVFTLEASKYIKNDDTIDITVSGQEVFIAAYHVPRGA